MVASKTINTFLGKNIWNHPLEIDDFKSGIGGPWFGALLNTQRKEKNRTFKSEIEGPWFGALLNTRLKEKN